MNDQSLLFADLPGGVAPFPVTLGARAQRIRSLVNVARGCIIEIGRELIEAKDECAHGGWLPWLETEFGWSEDVAQRYMRVARAFQIPQGAVFADLTIDATALYALAGPEVPQAVRDEAIERAADGEHITKQDAEAMVEAAVEEAVAQAIEEERKAQAEDIAARDRHIADIQAQLDVAQTADSTLDEAKELLDDLGEKLAKAIEQRDAAKAELDAPTDLQVIRLVNKISKRKPSAVMLTTLASALGRPITYQKKTYEPVDDSELTKVQETRAAAATELANLADPKGAPAIWHRALMALRALNAAPPAKQLLATRYHGFDHAFATELPKAKEWLDEFSKGMTP